MSQIPLKNVAYTVPAIYPINLFLRYKTNKMKIIIYLAASANGMISNNRNVPDWLSQEYGQGFMEISQRTQAVIMGKKTYNILAPDYLPLKEGGSLVVLTHDTKATPHQSNVLFTSDSPEKIVAQLAAKGHTEAVIIGGTQTVSAFIKAGLVNEIILVLEPVLFGKGLPLMEEAESEYKLSLLDVKKLNDHTIQLHYEVN
jgi:dihydrofolate reductase